MNLKMSPAPIILIAHEKSHNQKRDNVRRTYYFTTGKNVISSLLSLLHKTPLKVNGRENERPFVKSEVRIITEIEHINDGSPPLKWPFNSNLDQPLFDHLPFIFVEYCDKNFRSQLKLIQHTKYGKNIASAGFVWFVQILWLTKRKSFSYQ